MTMLSTGGRESGRWVKQDRRSSDPRKTTGRTVRQSQITTTILPRALPAAMMANPSVVWTRVSTVLTSILPAPGGGLLGEWGDDLPERRTVMVRMTPAPAADAESTCALLQG